MAQGGQKSSKILWVDANDLLNVYKEEPPVKITTPEVTGTGYIVEICETGKEEEEAVLKPDADSADEDQGPLESVSSGGRGRGRGRGRGHGPRGISRTSRGRRRRVGRSRWSDFSRVDFYTSSQKRQRNLPREYENYELLPETKEENDDPDYHVMLEEEFVLTKKRPGYQPSGDSFPCYVCNKTFLPTTLSSHVRNYHPDFPETQCYICGEVFGNSSVAQAHLKADHLSNYSYHCPECGKGYHYYLKLVRHLRNVHAYASVPTREELRSAGESRLSDIGLDSQEPQENECRCIVCRRIFRIDEIKEHMHERHQEFPKTQCFVCERRFPSPLETEKHMESTHFKLSPFSCPECMLNFNDLQEWSKHMENTHQSDTLYKCEQCDKVFGWKKYLRQHIRQDHSGSGSIFALRGDFRAEKTTLKEECDRQQRLLDSENSRIAGNGTTEVTTADAADSAQHPPTPVNRLSSELLETKGVSNETSENSLAENEVVKNGSLLNVIRKPEFSVLTSHLNEALIDTNSSQLRIVDPATDLNVESRSNEILVEAKHARVGNSFVFDEKDGPPLSEIGLHKVAFEVSDSETNVTETVAHSSEMEEMPDDRQDTDECPLDSTKLEVQNSATEINGEELIKIGQPSNPGASGHTGDPKGS